MLTYCLAATVFLYLFAMGLPIGFALALLAAGSFVMTQAQASSNALIQHNIPDSLRGRVMSLYVLCVLASFPIGAFVGPIASGWIGPQMTTIADAAIVVTGVLVIRLTHPALREAR
jgi:ENTS family enterobactin (siderophore) exporter